MRYLVILIICFLIGWFGVDFWRDYQQQIVELPHPSKNISEIFPVLDILDELGGATSCISWQYDEKKKAWVAEGKYWDEKTGQIKDFYKEIKSLKPKYRIKLND